MVVGAPLNTRLLSRKTTQSLNGVLNEATAVPAAASGGFGARMLAKFGWEEGKGLGKNGDGMADHIRVTKRADGLGLGASNKPVSEWAPPPGANLGRAATTDSDSDSEDEREALVRQRLSGSGVIPGMSDQDLFALCGGARLGMRARASQGGKEARMAAADRAAAAAMQQPSAVPTHPPTSSSEALGDSGSGKKKRQRSAEDATSAESTPVTADSRTDAEVMAKVTRKSEQKAERKAERKAARKAERKAARKAEKRARTGERAAAQ